ncbi:hypothetical protein Y032_0548g3286 [Ancylostoma ceylanicum]|uniref:Secreted protein n=1 Tax=Ancylostoma ceylanicum TaxID=53326 RepID=A0A016WQW9_9BILA|nr:hypothetical protein Y032_0548g3286 [Ancylostoma ceylanicum]
MLVFDARASIWIGLAALLTQLRRTCPRKNIEDQTKLTYQRSYPHHSTFVAQKLSTGRLSIAENGENPKSAVARAGHHVRVQTTRSPAHSLASIAEERAADVSAFL